NVVMGGETGLTISNLSPDTYQVLVTDDQNCTQQASFVINNLDPFVVVETETQISCIDENDGSVTLNVSGGTGPYSYNWSRNGNFYANTADIVDLDPAVYEVL